MSDHRQRLIDAYLKAPELLQLRLGKVFATCEEKELPVHNDAVDEIGVMIGEGQPDLLGRVADVVLEVARNDMMKENNGKERPS